VTWKGLAYLFARFPLGILAFVIVVTWLSLTVGLIAAPFVYSLSVDRVETPTFQVGRFQHQVGCRNTKLMMHYDQFLSIVAWDALLFLGVDRFPPPIAQRLLSGGL
jgi:hypothetical protein